MKNPLFAMDGIVTDIAFTFSGDEMNGFTGEANFFLNGKEILLTTDSNLLPFKNSSHIVIAAERTDNDSLEAIACYVKDEKFFSSSAWDLGGLIAYLRACLFLGISVPIIFFNEIVLLFDEKDFISASFFALLVIGSIFFFFVFIFLLIPRCFKYRKALKVVDRRLQRISLLEKK